MKPQLGSLILVPVSLGETPWRGFMPEQAHARVTAIRHFVVETEKTARQQLKRLEHPLPIRALDIRPLPENADAAALDALLAPLHDGADVGLMSDAGCPAVADPGARLVDRAQRAGLRVEPLVGPSSILLALMASGLNGQSFAFHGYLPVGDDARNGRIRQLEQESAQLGRTQIFIETPYRNERMLEALLKCCKAATRLCIARDITTQGEYIRTRTIAQWRKAEAPDLSRRPTIFLILGA
ncbi:SAM-dependent methyltransferase [Rhodocyclaceae bacterium SMB388]